MSNTSISLRRSIRIATTVLVPPALLATVALLPPFATSALAQAREKLPPVTVEAPHQHKRKPRGVATAAPAAATPERGRAAADERRNSVPASAELPPEAGFNRGLSSSDSASLVTDLPGGG